MEFTRDAGDVLRWFNKRLVISPYVLACIIQPKHFAANAEVCRPTTSTFTIAVTQATMFARRAFPSVIIVFRNLKLQ